MQNKTKFSLISICTIGMFFLLVTAIVKNSYPVFSTGDRGTYSLSLSSQKINSGGVPSLEEVSTNIVTNEGTSIEIKYANVINNSQGWQTILPGGYFYNPINNSLYKNKINGLISIRFSSESVNSLSLYYGHTINDEEIIYSNEKELEPNVTYTLNDVLPNFFYIKNNTNQNIDITELSINYSCLATEYAKQDLNILMIGNSFADDTVFFSSRVAAAYGINLNLYDAYIGGCTINTHYTNLQNGSETYSMRHMNNGSWVYEDNMSLSAIINSHTWDIITFQQASAEVGRSDSYTNLESFVSMVRDMVGSEPKFYWHQTWAYDKDYHDYYDYFAYFGNNQMTMYNSINDCYSSEVAPLGLLDKMIPAGTAVQNLRTSYMKNTFSRDGKHMSNMHGRYLLGLNFVSTIYDIDLDMSPCAFLPAEIDPSYKKPAYEAVKNARKNPLSCTNSQYLVRELEGYDLSNYTEIDAEILGCSFWNCTDSTYYNRRLSNSNGTSNIYCSTKRFTQSTLPIGSLVVIDDSFGVRPEAWVSDAVQYSRKTETYQNIIAIDDEFWNGYEYRAFNIFKIGKTTLLGQYDQVFGGFHVYVPNSQMAGLTPKSTNSYYESDKILFSDNSRDIDSYIRMHLDPITGFYKCDSYYDLTNSYVDDTAKKFLCTRPFYASEGDLPSGTVIILDSGYQWRSDCWGAYGSYKPRPDNVSNRFTVLDSSFWEGFRRRTFNVSSTSSSYVGQNYISFMSHFRIYIPNA